MPRLFSILTLSAIVAFACQNNQPGTGGQPPSSDAPRPVFAAVYGTPVLDGSGADDLWEKAEWLPINHLWAGTPPEAADFSGQYKLAWDENNLYLLAETTDDALHELRSQALGMFWDDDCLVVFLDEDASGGEHEYSHNAFAYHIALDGRVADMAPDSAFRSFDDHCLTRRIAHGNVSTWEIAVRIFDGNKFSDQTENLPKRLKRGKKMGFALAYCDNDHSPERESFLGNLHLSASKNNRGWLNADAFGTLELR